MKKCCSIIILLSFLLSAAPAFADVQEPQVSEYKDIDSIWELVSEYSPSDEITAAVTAAIYYESFCISNAVGGGYLIGDEYSEEVTRIIDAGLEDGSSREDFINHRAGKKQAWGYGLLQWVEFNELCPLYDFAQESGTSISDARMQVRFIFYDLQNNRQKEWSKILEAKDAAEAGMKFAHWYVGTDDGLKLSDRAWLASKLYDEHIKK